jgi:ribosomal protein S18 acetylase RimI-like enzyme
MRVEREAIRPGEYPAHVAALRQACFPRWYLAGHHRGSVLYRAVSDRRLIGYLIVQVEGAVAYVEEVAVSPQFRRQGVARSLVAAAASDLSGTVQRVMVFPMSGEAADSRRTVFESLGFRAEPDHRNVLVASPLELVRSSDGDVDPPA